jgi:hypothetical protein
MSTRAPGRASHTGAPPARRASLSDATPAHDPRSTRVQRAMHQLQVDATAVAVVQKLRAAGIRPILLKGSSLSRWLYPAEPWRRGYTDVDLLVAPEQFKAAGAVLAQLGYRNVTDDQPQAHAFTWIPEPPDAVAVDLHRRLYFMRASDEAVWTALSESSDTIRLGPHQLEVMDLTARAMLLPLHAARHGIRTRKPLRDLEVALRRVDDETWRGGAGSRNSSERATRSPPACGCCRPARRSPPDSV